MWGTFFNGTLPNEPFRKSGHFLSQPHPESHTCSAANRKGSKLTLTSYLMRETFDFLLSLNEEIYSNTSFVQKSSQVHSKGQKNTIDKIENQQISEWLSLTWARTRSLCCLLPWEVWRAELCVRILEGNKERECQKMEIEGTRSFPNYTDFNNCKK